MCHIWGRPPYASVSILREMPEYVGGSQSLWCPLRNSVLGAWEGRCLAGVCSVNPRASSHARGSLPRVSVRRQKGQSFQAVLLWGYLGCRGEWNEK